MGIEQHQNREVDLVSADLGVNIQPDLTDLSLGLTGARERIECLKETLPEAHQPYADKYFLRSGEILRQEGLNPWVKAQVFIRKGPGDVHGIEEAVAIIEKYSGLKEKGGSIKILPEGSEYKPGETLMIIEGPVQSIIELETMYLGVLTAETTKANDGVEDVDLDDVRDRMKAVVAAADGRPVLYFGPRHWHYADDARITAAAFEGGAVGTSSDIGARVIGEKGSGTIPHALENVCALKYGMDNAVKEATLAFDRVIDPSVPRIALNDYNNKEIDDSIATANALEGRLFGVRVDTCGENVAQGALCSPEEAVGDIWKDIPLPPMDDPDAKFWYGNGVTITGVYALRKALDAAGHEDVKIYLSSGFGNPEKVKAFVNAEKVLGVKLFDALGVGGVISPARYATMDIVAAGEDASSLKPVSKVGRVFRSNSRLQEVPAFAKPSARSIHEQS